MLKPVLASAIKMDLAEPDIYDLRVCIYTNGASQDTTLKESYSLVYLAHSLCITIAITAAFGLSLSLIDMVNAYQNTILMPDQMLYIYPPQFYIEWF